MNGQAFLGRQDDDLDKERDLLPLKVVIVTNRGNNFSASRATGNAQPTDGSVMARGNVEWRPVGDSRCAMGATPCWTLDEPTVC